MSSPSLQSLRLKSFKAVRDSGIVKFTPLTVFIGSNGSGKSSVIEGLEMLHTIITADLDTAVAPWRSFRDILNKAVSHKLENKPSQRARPYYTNPISFDLRSSLENRVHVRYSLEIADGPGRNDLFIKQETLNQKKERNIPSFDFTRDDRGHVTGKYTVDEEELIDTRLPDGTSLLNLISSRLPYDIPLREFIEKWQFISLIPQNMGSEKRQNLTMSQVKLEKDGSNIAEYLLHIQNSSPQVFESIIDTLRDVLPYSQDLQVALRYELDTVYLQLTEENFKVPGWLLSTGTLRILALLALLRHPEPPPLIVIEEIENGLDPSSVNLIVNEIREATESGKTQVILTTHSPYLLDQLSLDDIILVERVNGQPVFKRPGDDELLQQWAERFDPGRLYTMSRLSGQVSK
ncbi:MAG TPA: AAA family ATPase [Ktedonobacteraceae bacterium]|nr:AAA family ATPase [Ktedonobacteraceae bacterium]